MNLSSKLAAVLVVPWTVVVVVVAVEEEEAEWECECEREQARQVWVKLEDTRDAMKKKKSTEMK